MSAKPGLETRKPASKRRMGSTGLGADPLIGMSDTFLWAESRSPVARPKGVEIDVGGPENWITAPTSPVGARFWVLTSKFFAGVTCVTDSTGTAP